MDQVTGLSNDFHSDAVVYAPRPAVKSTEIADTMSTALKPSKGPKSVPQKPNPYPAWSPRFWHGMTVADWAGLVLRNRLALDPRRYHVALGVSVFTVLNSFMKRLQDWRHGAEIARTQVEHDPIFIVGHWRSGTTYLHELLSLDDRFASPTTYQCFAPHHFLLSEDLVTRYGNFLLPHRRPMDNVDAGWSRPQEDEFALCILGAPSPYLRMAFPNRDAPHLDMLNMDDVDEAVRDQWRAAFEQNVRLLTYRHQKQLIMKSPPHTGRVELLSQMYSRARFIHIVREPYTLFASSRRLWKSLDDVQGLQVPRHEQLDEYILEAMERMYHGFQSQRARMDSSKIFDIHYEDLVVDPVGQLAAAYESLDLGDFKRVAPLIEAETARQVEYKTNHYELPVETKRQVRQRWSMYFEEYGYD